MTKNAAKEKQGRKEWDCRGHFFAAAAEAMRRILIESARRKRSRKEGGGLVRREFDEAMLTTAEPCEDILALDEALTRLTEKDPRKAEVVKLRYFAGLTGTETAEVLGISVATAERDWAYARAWLHQELTGGAPESRSMKKSWRREGIRPWISHYELTPAPLPLPGDDCHDGRNPLCRRPATA